MQSLCVLSCSPGIYVDPLLLRLPFQQLHQLQQLHLYHLIVENQQEDLQGQNSWSNLTTLTSLRLGTVGLQTPGGYAALSVLSNLKRLEITDQLKTHGVGFYPSIDRLHIALTGLSQLTRLVISNMYKAMALELSNLEQLQQLSLHRPPTNSSCYRHLPTALTKLEMYHGCGGVYQLVLTPRSTPRIMGLVNLQQLKLSGHMSLNPSILSIMTKLTHLTIDDLDLVVVGGSSNSVEGMRVLLETLPCLSNLQDLALAEVGHRNVREVPATAFSALVSSKHLTALCLHKFTLATVSGQYLFQNQLPVLRVLNIEQYKDEDRLISSLADMQQLVKGCPSLHTLRLENAVVKGVPLGSLGQLSGLTNLMIGGRDISDSVLASSVNGLVHLTTLQALKIHDVNDLTASGLLQLRQLTDLTSLTLEDCKLADEVVHELKLVSKVS